jgi:hypothetical protein
VGVVLSMAYHLLATRNTSGLHPNLRGLGFLGDSLPLSPTSAMQQAIQQSSGKNLNPKQFQNSAWLSAAASFIQSGALPATPPYGPDCSGQSAPNLNLFQTASGLALGTTAATVGFLASPSMSVIPASAVPVVGWAIAGVGALVGLISAIFRHHAAAVKRDLTFGCSAIPAVNNVFSVIAQGVQSGQIKSADAASALDHVYSEYQSAGGAAINYSPWCNSNCELGVILLGMVIYWKAQYQAMAAQQAATAAEATAQAAESSSAPGTSLPSPAVPVSQAASSTTVPAGTSGFSLSAVPAWGWLLAAAFGAWAVL